MAGKEQLRPWIVEALEAYGGSAHLVKICEHVWRNHEQELRASGDLFFTWQYDIRWVAQTLRDEGTLAKVAGSRAGIWTLDA